MKKIIHELKKNVEGVDNISDKILKITSESILTISPFYT